MQNQELEPAVLSQADYGIRQEGVHIRIGSDLIHAPSGQDVQLSFAVWNRSESSIVRSDETGSIFSPQQANDAVFMSGFGTRSQDWPIAFESLGRYWPTVVGIDHPDAPTSKIMPGDKPLNESTFFNSGFVVLRSIENRIYAGTLRPGITVIGVSTGCPVLLEAVAQDIREADLGLHPRYITSVMLNAPAGLMDRSSYAQIAAGAGGSVAGYMKKEYVRNVYFRLFGTLPYQSADVPGKTDRVSVRTLFRNMKNAWNNPEWRDIRSLHIGFELFEFVVRRLPMDEFMACFHRMWPNQDPHFLPDTPSILRNQELVYRNTTENARTVIRDTDIRIELFDGDKAVPPDGFLTAGDRSAIESAELTPHDLEELYAVNRRRAAAHQPAYGEPWMIENKKAIQTVQRIVNRVRELFPDNRDNVHVSIAVGTNHLTPKSDLDLLIDREVQTPFR